MAQETKDSEERRNEFVEAAEKLFRENGIMETTINSIVKEMNVAKGLFYYYFRSKDDVIEAISEKYNEVFRQMMEYSMDAPDYGDRLEQFVENTVGSYRELMQKLQTDSDVDLTILSTRSLEEAKYSVSEGLRSILDEGVSIGWLQMDHTQYYADLLTAGIEELIRKNEADDEEIKFIVLDLIERAGKD